MKIGNTEIGDGHPCFIISEIGINASGSIDTARKLIDVAKDAGCQMVKFQKRTIELNYTPEELAQSRESPFGTTNGDLKRALEFDYKAYEAIDRHCKDVGILWTASAWDVPSVEFLEQFNVPCHKVPSARNNDVKILQMMADIRKPTIVSCGMAHEDNISWIEFMLGGIDQLAFMVTTATYPAKLTDLHLNRILRLKKHYSDIPIGYSNHHPGIWASYAAVAMGANLLEVHITLDRTSFGSDQSSSIEPAGLKKLVSEIRDLETARGNYDFGMLDCEREVARKLKRYGT